MKNNYVYFKRAGFATFEFTKRNSSISDGKELGAITSGIDEDGVPFICVEADRHKTDKPAKFFKEHIGKGLTLSSSSSLYPEKLNFAVQGDLKFRMIGGSQDIYCDDIVIGQGSTKLQNNWWIGGKHMVTGASYDIAGLGVGAIAQTCGYDRRPGFIVFALANFINSNTFHTIVQELELA